MNDLWSASTRTKAQALPGPILVVGADGFIGKNLVASLRASNRRDVHTLVRGETLPGGLLPDNTQSKMNPSAPTLVTPGTIFNLAAHGAYEDQADVDEIYEVNFSLVRRMVEAAAGWKTVKAFVNCGSSSEYGENSNCPLETAPPTPNSHYAIAKVCAQTFLHYAARTWDFPSYHLRLYSVYGPHERATRLIPTVISKGLLGHHATYADAEITRDFVYVDDATAAMVHAAWTLATGRASSRKMLGAALNIATGKATRLRDLATWATERFSLKIPPMFTGANRKWDHQNLWCGDASRARYEIMWTPDVPLQAGLEQTIKWVEETNN